MGFPTMRGHCPSSGPGWARRWWGEGGGLFFGGGARARPPPPPSPRTARPSRNASTTGCTSTSPAPSSGACTRRTGSRSTLSSARRASARPSPRRASWCTCSMLTGRSSGACVGGWGGGRGTLALPRRPPTASLLSPCRPRPLPSNVHLVGAMLAGKTSAALPADLQVRERARGGFARARGARPHPTPLPPSGTGGRRGRAFDPGVHGHDRAPRWGGGGEEEEG